MKCIWSKKDLSLALNQDIEFDGGAVCSNSKEIQLEDIFIALKGGKTDGHDYIEHALNNGVSFVIASHIPSKLKQTKKIIIVEDTYQALLSLAAFRRRQSKAKFISITGSCGKTSTKFYLTQVLSKFAKAICSKASFNNYLGVPLTLASLPLDADYAVMEIGTNHLDEIKPLAQMVKADIAIITNVLPAHIGNFSSLHELVYEKAQIFQGILPNAIGIINKSLDPKDLDIIQKEATLNGIQKLLYFGVEKTQVDAAVLDYKLLDNSLAQVQIQIGNMILNYTTGVTGKHNAVNFLTIILACMHLELDLEKVLTSFKDLKNIDGRGKLISVTKFDKSFKIIDDAFNANPGSTSAALENFAHFQSEQKVVVLSDMLELGKGAITFHQNLKPTLIKSGAYKFIAVGEMMKHLYDYVEGIEKHFFQDTNKLLASIQDLIVDGDVLLFKGSKSTNLHQVVDFLKN